MRPLSWDIETAWEGQANKLQSHMPLGVTCAYMLEEGQKWNDGVLWWAGMSQPGLQGATYAPQMTTYECQTMVKYLADKYLDGYIPMTWNGIRFEWLDLAHETGWWQECKVMALLHLDLFWHLFCRVGYFVKMDRAMRGMGLPGKSDTGMTGAEAPAMWKKDPEAVLEYVKSDVIQPMKWYHLTIEHGFAMWGYKWTDEDNLVNKELDRNKRGFGSIDLPEGWLPVFQAWKLPRPDTRRMTRQPPTREEALDWIIELPKLTETDRGNWNISEGVLDIALSYGF